MSIRNDIKREQMNIVVVGHVDHGKSTVLGRLLADTGSLPKGKLEQVKEICKKNAKPFEYAFLLDALKDEQAQGITIDAARCFFSTKKRDYIIIDTPGHIEFLKNMITGAAHAEAALLVIDAKEGIQENSKRHGHMLSMLGIKQVSILVNKLDLIDYKEDIFNNIKSEYTKFLKKLNVRPINFIPISAIKGDNIANVSKRTPWYTGITVLEQLDNFKKEFGKEKMPFRFPVQDIYKFTQKGDERRITAGTIETGRIKIGDKVTLLPSFKETEIKSIESFNTSVKEEAEAGEAIGFTLTTQLYIKPGEIMVKSNEMKPKVSNRFKVNIFWVGKVPLVKNKVYKLKLAATRVTVKLKKIIQVLDASNLTIDTTKEQIERHDVAECIFETAHPIAFDIVNDIETMGRLVIIENYEIVGGGIILENIEDDKSTLKAYINERDHLWEFGSVSKREREETYRHKSKFVIFTDNEEGKNKKMCEIARAVERRLFKDKFLVYYLGLANLVHDDKEDKYLLTRDDYINRLGDLARMFTDSGQIFITTISELNDYEVEKLKLLNAPNDILIVSVGKSNFTRFKGYEALNINVTKDENVEKVYTLLKKHEIILDYYI